MPLSDVLEATLDLLFPSRCGGCDVLLAERALLCPTCAPLVEKLGHPRCSRCAEPFEGAGEDHPCAGCLARPPAFAVVRAPHLYGGPTARAICRLKYGGHTDLAVPLGRLIATAVHGPFDRVVPVPLHPRRLAERGFNQAALLAAAAAAAVGCVRLDTSLLVRRRATPPQAGLGRSARRRNVQGAFALVSEPGRLEGERVLLVDDVVTTAETARSCARALRRAGAVEVVVGAVARSMW